MKWEFQDNHWLGGGAWETGIHHMLQTTFKKIEEFPYWKQSTYVLHPTSHMTSPLCATTPGFPLQVFPVHSCIVTFLLCQIIPQSLLKCNIVGLEKTCLDTIFPFIYPLYQPQTLLPFTTAILGTGIYTHCFYLLPCYSTYNTL